MTAQHKPITIAGHTVERIEVGKHTLGQVVVNDDVTVVFRMNDGGGPGGGIDVDCLSCRISHISECANLVCPDIKKHDPEASCSDAIKECMDLACRGSCSGSSTSGGLIVLA